MAAYILRRLIECALILQLGWFPIGGYWAVAHLVLPTVTLAFLGAGRYSRMTRSP